MVERDREGASSAKLSGAQARRRWQVTWVVARDEACWHERRPLQQGSHELEGLLWQVREVGKGGVADLAFLATALAQERGRALPVAVSSRSGDMHFCTAIPCEASHIEGVPALCSIARACSWLRHGPHRAAPLHA